MGVVQTDTATRSKVERGRLLFALVAPLQAFFRLEAAGGLVMIGNAALALVWANSPLRDIYAAIFRAPIRMMVANQGIDWTVHHFTNDALMTLFFVVAGSEIKRELVQGELRTWRRAALPLMAAAGGMLMPALIYLAFNSAGHARAGWAVPMATDIAFALGCLSLVRRRVPTSLFVFLTALAIFDDLGAVVVIALFYGGIIEPEMVIASLLLAGVLGLLNRARVQSIWPYALIGSLLWVAVLESGIHATIAGVVIGLSLPTTPRRAAREALDDLDVAITSLRRYCDRHGVAPESAIRAVEQHVKSVQSPLDRLMHRLHGVVAFGVVPLFALANAGVSLSSVSVFGSSVTLGAFLGLTVGKPLGVLGATWLAMRLGVPRPTGATSLQLLAVAFLAGIGFTMSLLIGNLGLGDVHALEDQAKVGVLAASFASAALGLSLLRGWSPASNAGSEPDAPLVLDVPRFAPGYSVQPCTVEGALIDRTLSELDVRRRFGVTVIGMWRGAHPGARKLEGIPADYRMSQGDVLLAAGADESVERFLQFARAGDTA